MLSSIEVPNHILDVVKTLTSQHCENADALHAALRNEHDATAAKLEAVDGHLGEVDTDGKNTSARLADASEEMNKIALRHAESAQMTALYLNDLCAEIASTKTIILAHLDSYDTDNEQRYTELVGKIDTFHNRMRYLFGGSTALILMALALVKYL